MIQGLKVTVPGLEVQRLLSEKAVQHLKRAQDYRKTYETLSGALGDMASDEAPKMSSMHSDPVKEAKQGIERHENNARENEFMAKYIKTEEEFLLDTNDLHRLGVLHSRY